MADAIRRDQIIEGYRLLLGRDPENEAVIAAYLAEHLPLWPFLKILAESPEGRRYQFDQSARLVVEQQVGTQIDVDPSPAQSQKLLAISETTWSELGKTDPFWSVLTRDDYRGDVIDDARREQFYATGAAEVQDLAAACSRNGVALDTNDTVLELGCGVGRVGEHLARCFARYIGVDISPVHLAIARRRFALLGINNVELLLLRDFLQSDVSYDVFYSILTLQHSPPPIALMLLKTGLARLNAGGQAFFQLPCHLYDYSFKLSDYLGREPSGTMEMHALPQAQVFRALAQGGMVPIEIVPYPRVGPIGLSYSFLASKPG